MSSNWEVFSETNHTPQEPNPNIFRQIWAFIRDMTVGAASSATRQLRQLEENSKWLIGEVDPLAWPRVLVARPKGQPVAKQLAHALAGQVVRQLVVVAPFFDPTLGGLRALQDALSPKQTHVIVQPKKVSVPGHALSRIPVFRFTPAVQSRRANAYLHAKIYLMETEAEEYCLWGSPNCSFAALAASGDQSNFELALLAKGPLGYFRRALGLGSSLTKTAQIDPRPLTLRKPTEASDGEQPQLASVEFHDGQLEATVTNDQVAQHHDNCRLRLLIGSALTAQVDVERMAKCTYRGKWNPGSVAETVLARLVFGLGANAIESTPAAVHFRAQLLAHAAPSRRAAEVERLLEGIQSETETWADGLERVCEIIFRLETLKNDDLREVVGPVTKTQETASNHAEDKEVAYDHFTAPPRPADHAILGSGSHSSLLLEIVQMLRPRFLSDTRTADDVDDEILRRNQRRYREEDAQDTAEEGDVAIPDPSDEAKAQAQLHNRLHRAYISLMQALRQHAESLDKQGNIPVRDELLCLEIVLTLVVQATARELEGASQCGHLIQPTDLERELLPSIALLLARSRGTVLDAHRSGGPVLLRQQTALTDLDSRQAAITIAVLLSALVAQRRKRPPESFDLAETSLGLACCLELVAARTLGALRELGILPNCAELEARVNSMNSRSPWLSSLGSSIAAEFQRLVTKSDQIKEVEHTGPTDPNPGPAQGVAEGDWVLTRHWGVTQVLRSDGEVIQIAIVDATDSPKLVRTIVSRGLVRPTGMTRTL
jgi:hypothetical protein